MKALEGIRNAMMTASSKHKLPEGRVDYWRAKEIVWASLRRVPLLTKELVSRFADHYVDLCNKAYEKSPHAMNSVTLTNLCVLTQLAPQKTHSSLNRVFDPPNPITVPF